MRVLVKQICLLLAAVLLTALVGSAVAALFGSLADVEAVWLATLVTSLPAVFVLVFLFRYGTGPEAIIAATAVRFGLTIGVASFAAWKFSTLRTLTFFLAVTVVYMACLFVETWLVLKEFKTDIHSASR